MENTAQAELTKMWQEFKAHGPLWYNRDGNYVNALSRAFNFKHDWLSRMTRLTFSVDPGSTRPVLFTAVEVQAVAVIKALLLVEGAAKDVVDVEDKGTSITQFAAREGYVDALKALVGAGADLQMARHDGATAPALLSCPSIPRSCATFSNAEVSSLSMRTRWGGLSSTTGLVG